MHKVMFQFRERHKRPTLQEIYAEFDLQAKEVDSDFGVLQSDSQEGLYVILVDESAQERIRARLKDTGADADAVVGIFSNPGIKPMVRNR
jgi:N-methylhydantoinase A/oxoprolinase/acetone carboxylase beta subunit